MLLSFIFCCFFTALPCLYTAFIWSGRSISRKSPLLSATSSSTTTSPSSQQIAGTTGQVFVCTNKYCREKGSDATMATFTFLTPQVNRFCCLLYILFYNFIIYHRPLNQSVQVSGVNCLGRCNKGPNVKILTKEGAFIEASMVRSVEKVVELLQAHLKLNINMTSADVLRLNCKCRNVFQMLFSPYAVL